METYAEVEKFCEESLLKGIALNFAADGRVDPQTFILARRDPEGHPLPRVTVLPVLIQTSSAERERSVQQHLVDTCHAAAIVLIHECWTTKLTDPPTPREENVVLLLEHENGGACSWAMRIDRSGDAPRLLDPVKAVSEGFGRLTGYFPKTRRTQLEA
jgi:hypothetical protein